MNDIEGAAARLRKVFRLFLRRIDAMGGTDAPTRSEQGVLAELDEKGPLTPSALSSIQKVRPQSMGQTLDSLDRRRWIHRAPHPTDRRRVVISLSPSGQKALAKGRRLRQAWLTGELARLAPQDRRTLVAAIGILEEMVQGENDDPSAAK